MRNPKTTCAQGFTLVEAVIVIVITGIIAGMVAMFIRLPVQGYMDSAARAELVDVADTALRRMARDLRLALPNSVRVTAAGGREYIEFLLTKTGGRYLADEDNPVPAAAGDILSFTNPNRLTFVPVGFNPDTAHAIVIGDSIVVYNLGPGFSPADAYDCDAPTVCNRARVAGVAFGNMFMLDSNPFANQTPPLSSPGRHFHVVTTPVTYVCDPGARTLTRFWNYAITAVQPTNLSAAPLLSSAQALLATGVTACGFSYNNAAGSLASQRSGLVGVSLTMQTPSSNSGAVTLFHQVHVDNTP